MSAFPNRPMKLWEVISGFREYPKIVSSVLSSDRWKNPYESYLKNWDDLVSAQHRDILDQLVPLELTREICEKCPNLYVLWPDETNLRQYHQKSAGYAEQKHLPKLTAIKVHDTYGPAVFEEVHEYGSVTVA